MGIGVILDIILIGIFIFSIWLGYKKGLTKSFLKIFSFLIAVIISFILFKPIANFVITQTDIVNNLQSTISKSFKNEDEKKNKLKDENKLQQEENENETIENEQNKIDKSNEISENKKENSQKEFLNVFNKYIEEKVIQAGNEAKEYVIETASREIAIFIINISVYIILFIVTRIILIFVKAFTELITKIPGIKQCDELGGGVYGGLRACIIILFIFTILSIILSIVPSEGVLEVINQSILAKLIYENNIIIKIIL